MTTIGFIGSGRIGGTVARLAVAGGYDVVVSNSREPSTLQGLVDQGPMHWRGDRETPPQITRARSTHSERLVARRHYAPLSG
jgi:3-hydroxyacyl-CoA dehydrogenase